MKFLKDYKSVVKGNNFISVTDLGEFDYMTLVSSLPYIKTLCSNFRVKPITIIRLIQKYQIKINELFEYSANHGLWLVAKDGVYVEKYSRETHRYEKHYFDVYLKEYSYISTSFTEIVYDLFKLKFPDLCVGEFSQEVSLFNNTETNFNLTNRIDSIRRFIDSNKLVTLKDLKKLLSKPDYINTKVRKTIFRIYPNMSSHDYVFYPLQGVEDIYYRCIPIRLSELFEKDWDKLCEEKRDNRCIGDVFDLYKNNPSVIALKKWFNS